MSPCRMARARRASPPPTRAILRSSSRAVRLLLLVALFDLLAPSAASASHPPDGGDASHSSIAAAAAAAVDGGVADAGMGLGIADQFVSTEDLPAANAAVDAAADAARDAATDAAGQAEFDPRLAGVEEEERLVDELLTWLEERGVTGIRGEEAAVEVVIDANTTLKASGRSRANLCMVARRPIAEGEVFLSLPRSFAVSALQAQEEAKPYEGEVHPFTALAAWVLRERAKGRASLWAPFVRLLPAHLPFPHLFRAQLVPELQYDVMLAERMSGRCSVWYMPQSTSHPALPEVPLDPPLLCLPCSASPALPPLLCLPCSASPALPPLLYLPCSASAALPPLLCLPCSASPALPPLLCLPCSASPALPPLLCLPCPVSHAIPSFLLPCCAQVMEHKKALLQEYNKCRPEAIANATQEEFFWAAGIVTSRMFALRPAAAAEGEGKGNEGEGQGEEERQEADISLVPYGDLFDTDDVPIAIWQDTGSRIEFTALTDIPAGQHVAVHYGELSNDSRHIPSFPSTHPPNPQPLHQDTGSSIEFMALTDIPAGQHVAVHYGELSNEGALVMRAMVLGGNYRLFSSFPFLSPLFPPPGHGQQHRALVMRAMVLGGNYRDHLHLFSSPQDALGFHVDKFLRGYGHTLERGTFESVEAELQRQAAAPQYAGVAQRFEYRMAPGSPLSAWFGGRFDPRLLGIFTALHALVVNNRSPCSTPSTASLSLPLSSLLSLSNALPFCPPPPHSPSTCLLCLSPDLSQVAQVSLLYGWMKDPKTTCDDLARLVDDDVSDAVPPAGNVLVERGQQLLKEFPTTLGEDLQLWRQLLVCKAHVLFGAVEGGEEGDKGGGDGAEVVQCGAEYVRELGEWEVILRYRMMKKYILRHLVGRLLHTCEN
ncbi:unnamed protein product [Closterium sp. NIES-54]